RAEAGAHTQADLRLRTGLSRLARQAPSGAGNRGEDVRDGGGHPPCRRELEHLVRPVSIAPRAEDAGDEELSAREMRREPGQKRNRAALAHRTSRSTEKGLGCFVDSQ